MSDILLKWAFPLRRDHHSYKPKRTKRKTWMIPIKRILRLELKSFLSELYSGMRITGSVQYGIKKYHCWSKRGEPSRTSRKWKQKNERLIMQICDAKIRSSMGKEGHVRRTRKLFLSRKSNQKYYMWSICTFPI